MKNRVVGLAQQGHDYLTIASMLNITVAEVAKAMKGEEITGPAEGGAASEPWKPLAPLYAAACKDMGGGYQVGRYRKNPWGTVECEGSVEVTSAVRIFTLPEGYRPKETQLVTSNTSTLGSILLEALPNGEVKLAQTGKYINLNGLRFSVE